MSPSSRTKSPTPPCRLRKAAIGDVPRIRELIRGYADRGLMLHRSLNDIYECVRDYWVCEKEREVVGCAALHVNWEDLAEVRSLAVDEAYRNQGIGPRLLKRCIREAKQLGIAKVFALTYVPAFFEKHGFRPSSKDELPRKIWSDCIRCHKFPDCDETALALDLSFA
jgi:amino-acid N-acetyltransferase